MHVSSLAAVLVQNRRFTSLGCTSGRCFHWLVAVAGLTSCRPTLQTSAGTPKSSLGAQSLSCRKTSALLGWSQVRSNKALQRPGAAERQVVSQTAQVQMNESGILEDLERELRDRLRIDLPKVVSGEDSLYFYSPDHNPFDLPESRLSKRGAEAYRLACEIRDLRERMGGEAICEASLLLEAIVHHADQRDQHRLGAKR